MAKRLTSIIIPLYNQVQYTKLCLGSIRHYTQIPHEIIAVDNNSTDDTGSFLRQQQDRVKVIRNEENLGFAKACNQGIRAASGDYILLLNNDVFVTPRWLENLVCCMDNAKDAGLVGPVTNYAFGIQKLYKRFKSPKDMIIFAESFNKPDPRKWMSVQNLSGYCLMISRSLYELIGGLDEGFPIGGAEDDDYCIRAVMAGRKLYCAGDTFVWHFGSATFRGENMDAAGIIARNRKRLHLKWTVN